MSFAWSSPDPDGSGPTQVRCQLSEPSAANLARNTLSLFVGLKLSVKPVRYVPPSGAAATALANSNLEPPQVVCDTTVAALAGVLVAIKASTVAPATAELSTTERRTDRLNLPMSASLRTSFYLVVRTKGSHGSWPVS